MPFRYRPDQLGQKPLRSGLSKIACPACGQSIHPFEVGMHSCHRARETVKTPAELAREAAGKGVRP